METLPGPNKSPFLEKLLRIAIPAAVIYGGVVAYNKWFAPNINMFMHNLPYLIGFGVVAVLALMGILYVIQNPTFIWMQYKNLCHYLTSFFIKMDPLSFMDRYIDILTEKRKGLQENKRNLKAQGISLKREMDELTASIDNNMKRALAAQQGGDQDEAAHIASMAASDKETLKLYSPIYQRIVANSDFLDKLDENWGRSIESLQHEVARKRKEYTTLKITTKALTGASEFGKGDTEAARIYKESVAALAQNVSQKLAYIDDFEKNSQGIMKDMAIDKKVVDNDGLAMLEDYKTNGKLFLPETNWTEATVVSSSINNASKSSATSSLIDLDTK